MTDTAALGPGVAGQDMPDAPDILGTVGDFLRALVPELTGERRYHAQVSVYLLEIVRREWAGATPPPGAGALAALIGGQTHESLSTAALARAIRSGALDDCADEVLAGLLDIARARASVVRPDYIAARDTHSV